MRGLTRRARYARENETRPTNNGRPLFFLILRALIYKKSRRRGEQLGGIGALNGFGTPSAVSSKQGCLKESPPSYVIASTKADSGCRWF